MSSDPKEQGQPDMVLETKEALARCLAVPDQLVIETTKKFVDWFASHDWSEKDRPC